jgi:NAD(P)-dependent dehydrogenase (short-subunit alcohol dehydrogenase family)
VEGRVALVTGGSRGIGEAIAHAYAAAGAAVVVASRRPENVEPVAEAIRAAGGRAAGIACHTGDREQVEALVERVVTDFGGLDVLVNNAATNPHFGPILTSEESHWQKTFEVNVQGYFHAARAAVPAMKQRGGGKIVNVASVAGLDPWAGLGVYSVSKAAVLMLTRVLAAELAADNVQVNAIAPGLIRTKFSEALWKVPGGEERVAADIPAGRIGEVEDLTGIALYLAAPASDYTTGQVFVVDGGQAVSSGVIPGAGS